MASARTTQRPGRRGLLLKTAVVVAVVGVVGTFAAVAQGYDAQEVPELETSVWVTRDAGQYARVNTELGEIDTVRSVADPSGVVQSGSAGYVFSQGYAQMWTIDPASPGDLVGAGESDEPGANAAVSQNTPALTRTVTVAGDDILYLTEGGEVYLGHFADADGTVRDPAPLDPFATLEVAEGEKRPQYIADAAAIDPGGTVVLFSAAEGGVRRYDIASGRFVGDVTAVPAAPDAGADLAMTFAAGRWVLSDPDDGLVWIEGRGEAVETGLSDGILQAGASTDARALLADRDGLVAVDTGDGSVDRLADATGTPAAPLEIGGVGYAAWISPTGGTLWSSDTGETIDLEVEAEELDDADADIEPVLRSNGGRGVLNETATGMVWTLPDGALVPTDNWDPLEETEQEEGTIQVDDVIQEEPPVAVADSFGVRAGALVSLPVLLNDHDPNKDDILTIDPASVTALSDGGFGSVGLVADDQQLVVEVHASSGSVTFSYAATDGVESSPPATVTLIVVSPDQNTAPVWCGVDACVQNWPTPQIAPGGFASIKVLPGWVDPEGDAISLADARADDPNAPVTVVPTADGRVVIRHQDPNANEAVVLITVTVSDALGATTTMPLEVRVTASPALDVQPVAVSAAVGEQRQVDIADSVSGGSGSYRLVDAVPVQGSDEAFVVAPSGASGTIDFSALRPGEYAASYTVQDTQTLAQQTAIVRYSVQSGDRPLAVPPLTAFVRPGEDSTVDVLSAVQNTTGRVLLVQEASSSDPGLSVSVIGQSYVRVSGSTASGDPGRIGVARVVISDGSGNTATTQLTVFLLDPSHGVGPIAVPDTVSVRAGNQIDIAVLANDVSPRGERIMLHPEVVGSDTDGELVFANDESLRYLAPEVPGSYTVRYSIYLENDPGRIDSAAVTINVLPEGSNRAPQPPILSARVLVGQTVAIPVPTSGLDPDGDAVVLADVDQPEAGAGVASINAAGDTIIYRAPAAAVRGGQLSFAYTVRDAGGEEGSALVRVGVLDSELSDVAPITYSDYVGVQRGSGAQVTVSPLLNDRDPVQGTLQLLDVRPNAPAGSSEWDRLSALIDPGTDLDTGDVVLRAGDVAGTNSYVYTVQSSSTFSTAEGLIVLGVSDEPAPDHPAVTDTIVTAKNRAELASGIDVVTGKVQWPTGDVSGLELQLWRATPGFSVEGSKISGRLPDEATVVPFTLTGADAAGNPVTSHGFLRIPAFDDMRVQLKTSKAALEVGEEESVQFSIRDYVDLAPGDAIDVRRDDAFAVQRANARCAPVGGNKVEYAAGREAPWSDSCSVVVRIAGQDRWSVVAVPIEILPKDPQAILSPVSRTVPPGEQVEIGLLAEMTSWEGGRAGDTAKLDFAADYSGSSFEVSLVNGSVIAQARADARPGTRETVRISVTSYGGLSSTITLVVGIAAPDAPRGATFTKQCDVSAGPSCTITAVGVPGEYDPFAGKPGSGLKVASVGTTGSVSCPVATVTRQSDTTLVATWPGGAKPVGGECVASFTVTDAQGRTGQGQVTIDVLGYPQTPASITTSSYSATSVTVRVALGEASNAHPAVSGVTLYEGAAPVSANCTRSVGDYLCTVSGLENGTRHLYAAAAVNSVGESERTSTLETWAYDQPTVTAVRPQVVFERGTTTTSNGVVLLEIDSSSDVQRLRLVVNGVEAQTINRTGDTTDAKLVLATGPRTIEVIPISRYNPPINPGQNEGAKKTITPTIVGAPYFTGGVSGTPSPTSIAINTPELNTNYSAEPTIQRWGAWLGGTPSCQMQNNGALSFGAGASGFVDSATSTVTGLTANQRYYVGVCATNGFGEAFVVSGDRSLTWSPPPAPTVTAGYTISNTASPNGPHAFDYLFAGGPTVSAAPAGFTTWYTVNGGSWSTSFGMGTGSPTGSAAVRYCLSDDQNQCGPTAGFGPAAGSAPKPVSVSFACYDDGFLGFGEPSADDVDATVGSYTVAIVDDPDTGEPTYQVTFTGQYAPFTSTAPLTHPARAC